MIIFTIYYYLFILSQNTNNDKKTRQSHKANKSGEEAQKESMLLIDIGLPQKKYKVTSNSKARIEGKIQ